MTLSVGMQANYASLIDKHQLDSLKKIREADKYAKKLLAVAPDAADAYLGLGTANYLIGSLPGSKKFFLGFAGIHGDKKTGIQQLEIAADHGHYLRPFAKILLALAAFAKVRQKWPAHNLRSSPRNSPRTRYSRASWPSSNVLLPQLLLSSEIFLSRLCFTSARLVLISRRKRSIDNYLVLCSAVLGTSHRLVTNITDGRGGKG